MNEEAAAAEADMNEEGNDSAIDDGFKMNGDEDDEKLPIVAPPKKEDENDDDDQDDE